jgi:hypothetical protein
MRSESAGSSTARASTSAPTSEDSAASASSSLATPFRRASLAPTRAAMDRTPSVKRARSAGACRGISEHSAVMAQPEPIASRWRGER